MPRRQGHNTTTTTLPPTKDQNILRQKNAESYSIAIILIVINVDVL